MSFSACLLLCLLGSLLSSSWAQEGAQNGTIPEARAPCAPGDLYYRWHCYQYCASCVSWEDAEVICQGLNEIESHLASLLSASEGRIVSNYLRRKGASSVWVGLQATRSHGRGSPKKTSFWRPKPVDRVWEWSDATPVSKTLWDGFSLFTAGSSDECVSMINIQNTLSRKSQQRSCTDALPFLCKYQAGY
ncbi:lithostathine-like isoform X1 [Sphaerodactylus townsendi]|uniref:lithostathine-like isoform X1 n=1 Tax=Sphaerodactylus townsendi TaxID=933632 RepID=UPI002026C2EC|nr:lithostathine-like isoform X1 [Sphaerodactylus townsendi]XP_048356776.1 lithostathine-like isoform X1 [Sphaerodactylus townsendi]XP_048356777.1 lithostathine-like isoform X1 [Sphaerodactylus townsendi]XP_048356778.1 lithostathine-like isoform X1 [Sphaerodactylus townsendi]